MLNQHKLLILFGLVSQVLLVICDPQKTASFVIPDALDYDKYALKFGKDITDEDELRDRADLFIGRTLKIAEHNEEFLSGRKSYFLKQNQFTDLPPEDLKLNADEEYFGLGPVNRLPHIRDLPASTYMKIREASVDANQDDGMSQASSSELEEEARHCTRTASRPILNSEKSNKLSYNRVINALRIDPEVADSIASRAEARLQQGGSFFVPNHYLGSFFDELPPTTYETFDQDDDTPSLIESFSALFKSIYYGHKEDDEKKILPEQPVDDQLRYQIDWRKLGCFTTPKAQGLCNSCYAFSVLSLMEFFLCRQSKPKQLVSFSSQYIVDCGHLVGLKGCQSGLISRVGAFIKNFGIQPELNYQYSGVEAQCSIKQDDPSTYGLYQPSITAWHKVDDITDWYKWLRKSPLIVGINVPDDFNGYGGGIHDGANCGERAHAMLLVGSGSEGSKEFWLLRNSFSDKWGEGGYFRLSKDAPMKCFNAAVVVRAHFQAKE